MAAVELVKDRETKESFDPAAAVGAYLGQRTIDNGLIIRAIGDTIAFAPPLIITEEEIDLLLDRFGRALDDTLSWVRDEGLAQVA